MYLERCRSLRSTRSCSRRTPEMPSLLFVLAIVLLVPAAVNPVRAQITQSVRPGSIHGVVINSVTREPISRALVSSPDNRYATLTDDQGRFEFTLPHDQRSSQGDERAADQPASGVASFQTLGAGPNMLLARKPGFLQDASGSAISVPAGGPDRDWTITLVPEAHIVGRVTLANAEAPDSIQLELYRRVVQDGRARWALIKGAASRSDGEFRFAELPAGMYKLLSREMLDRDPLNFDPRGRLYGYPPVFYPSTAGFNSAAAIPVAAGETAEASLTLVRHAYYNVRIPVVNASGGAGLGVNVFIAGNRGPGYSLGYNAQDEAIEGLLPDGTYTVEATSFGINNRVSAGSVNIVIHDGTVSGPPMTLLPGVAIPLAVKEEFTATRKWEGSASWTTGGRRFNLTGPRRYLNLMLEPEDDFGGGRPATLRSPTPNDQSLVVENVLPGRYWLRITSARGYVASARSGNADLLREPLTVGEGGSPAPIEITLRDETAEIEGTVEGIASPSALTGATGGAVEGAVSYAAAAHVYCIPLPDTGGNFTEVWVSPDGSFQSAPLPPGAYRVLAFARPQSELEYRNPDAMQAYDSKGPVVRVAAGQKESVRVQLIAPE